MFVYKQVVHPNRQLDDLVMIGRKQSTCLPIYNIVCFDCMQP